MVTLSNLARLGLVAGMLALVGVATAEARDIRVTYPTFAPVGPAGIAPPAFIAVPEAPAVAEEAAPAPVVTFIPNAQEKAGIGQANAGRIVEAPGCRKVKVIYSGYGESERAGCAKL